MRFKSILLILLFVVMGCCALAQTKIQGIIIDSAYNNVLESVSVSIYEVGKKTVEKVSLTDRFGKFSIIELVADKPFIVEIAIQGFEKVTKEFQLKPDEVKDFGHINIEQITEQIEEIVIIPPVRMNGDTLEFNADAFQLDSNAVVEDLLRKLPGILVWGDGSVTYNGKEVPNVLVNGKPFFGNDKVIALQNIEKTAIDKLQVYDLRSKEEKERDPDDKKIEMNVVLKNGKERLYFGNLGGGIGYPKRYATHFNINGGTNQSQITLAYSGNNVNKDLNQIDQLLKNTTYKGIGINADFDSDFLRQGLLTQDVFGMRYQYDIEESKDVFNHNMVQAYLSARWNKTQNENNSLIRLLNSDVNENNTRSIKSNSEQDLRIQTANIEYKNQSRQLDGKRKFNINSTLNLENASEENFSYNNTLFEYMNNKSTNDIQIGSFAKTKVADLKTFMELTDKNGGYINEEEPLPFLSQIYFNLTINTGLNSNSEEANNSGNYVNHLFPNLNKNYNRNYIIDSEGQYLNLELLMRYSLDYTFTHNLRFKNNNIDHLVNDLENNIVFDNEDLTHRSAHQQFQYEPKFSFKKKIYSNDLYGRNSNRINLTLEAGLRFFKDYNESTLKYRNLDLSNTSFRPKFILSQSHSKIGTYQINNEISYNYDEEMRNLDEMRPIYDDINPGFRNMGALSTLKKTKIHSINFSSNYFQQHQYGLRANFNLGYNYLQNGLTYSTIYVDNQQQLYTIQISKPINYWTYLLDLGKPFLVGREQTLALRIKAHGKRGMNYQYVENIEQRMLNYNFNINGEIYYTKLSKLQIGLKNNLGIYKRTNINNKVNKNNNYRLSSMSSGLSCAYSFNKKLTLNSNVMGRFNSSSHTNEQDFIWNANISYRMLKGNNLEAKFAAYDLLNQNKGFYFQDGLTEFTSGYRNVLTQYFMFSISYMPRQFGTKRTK